MSELTPEQRAADRALCAEFKPEPGPPSLEDVDGLVRFLSRAREGWPAALDALDAADVYVARLREVLDGFVSINTMGDLRRVLREASQGTVVELAALRRVVEAARQLDANLGRGAGITNPLIMDLREALAALDAARDPRTGAFGDTGGTSVGGPPSSRG